MQHPKLEKEIPLSNSNDTNKILLEYENNGVKKKVIGRVEN